MMREGTNWYTAWRTRGWRPDMGQQESSRPLLTASEQPDEETGEQNENSEREGYGATEADENRPRVEPSHFTERNAWNEN